MDGFTWKTLFKIDDLGGKPTIFGNTNLLVYISGILSQGHPTFPFGFWCGGMACTDVPG